jgi:hypothetical protein
MLVSFDSFYLLRNLFDLELEELLRGRGRTDISLL